LLGEVGSEGESILFGEILVRETETVETEIGVRLFPSSSFFFDNFAYFVQWGY
jgi:hypothetical protein